MDKNTINKIKINKNKNKQLMNQDIIMKLIQNLQYNNIVAQLKIIEKLIL